MRCPQCQSEFDSALSPALPFCSERCREIDLGRWLDERYGLPSVPDPEADGIPEEDWANGKESSNNNPSSNGTSNPSEDNR